MIANIHCEDLHDMIVELGERITFVSDRKSDKALHYGSLTPNRSNKAIATTEGSNLYVGNITFDSVKQQKKLEGAYFKRETEPDSTYLLYSTFSESCSPRIGTVSCFNCNEKIDVISHYEFAGGFNEFGEEFLRPVYAYKGIYAYSSEYTKEAKNIKVGDLVSTISYITFPAKYPVTSDYIIMKDSFVEDKETHKIVARKIPYKIESIDVSMVHNVDGEFTGTIKCLITEAQSDGSQI